MTIKKNFIIKLALFLAAAVLLHTFILAVAEFQVRENDDYVSQTVIILGLVLSLPVFYFFNMVSGKLASGMSRILKLIIEIIVVIGIVLAGLYLRCLVIRAYPVAMESDYKFYYDVAVMLKNGTILTQSGNEYISLFPNTFGYGFILSLVLRIFGENTLVPLYFNAVLSAGGAVICYLIGKLLFGRRAGLITLILSMFIPSQIIYSSINGSEVLFTFLIYSAAFLVLHIQKKYSPDSASSFRIILLLLISGALMALSSAVRPMGLIMLIAVVIALLSSSQQIDSKVLGNRPFAYIYMSRGWLKASTVIIGYLILSVLINAGIKTTIDKDISTAAGYSLLVGLDIAHDGGYSEESMNYLTDIYEDTGDPNLAHRACLDLAIERVKQDPIGILKLLAKKVYLMWADDLYGVTTNHVTLDNQGLLTTHRLSQLSILSKVSGVYYILLLFCSAAAAVLLLLKKDRSNIYIIVLFFLGVFALHLFVEVQNRYHYYILNSLSILAAAGIYMLRKDRPAEEEGKAEAAQAADSDETPGSRADHLSGFDMQKAIEEGHITVAVSQAYAERKQEHEEST